MITSPLFPPVTFKSELIVESIHMIFSHAHCAMNLGLTALECFTTGWRRVNHDQHST